MVVGGQQASPLAKVYIMGLFSVSMKISPVTYLILLCLWGISACAPLPSTNQASIAETWHQVFETSGTTIKETESFPIKGNEWRVTWSVKAGGTRRPIFQIYVYNADGSLKGVAANIEGVDEGSTVMRGAGSYYLKVLNTAQPYGIVVEDKY